MEPLGNCYEVHGERLLDLQWKESTSKDHWLVHGQVINAADGS